MKIPNKGCNCEKSEVEAVNESAGLQKAFAPGSQFPGLGNWWHFVKNLSRPVKLSTLVRLYMKQRHTRLSGQLTITCHRASGHPKTAALKICKYDAVLAHLHHNIFGGDRLGQFEGAGLYFKLNIASKLECLKQHSLTGANQRSSGCWLTPLSSYEGLSGGNQSLKRGVLLLLICGRRSGMEIVFKVTIRLWRGRSAHLIEPDAETDDQGFLKS